MWSFARRREDVGDRATGANVTVGSRWVGDGGEESGEIEWEREWEVFRRSVDMEISIQLGFDNNQWNTRGLR